MFFVGSYALLGLIVLATRLLFPVARESAIATPVAVETETANDTAHDARRKLAA